MDPRRSDPAIVIAETVLGAGAGAAELAWRASRPLRDVGAGMVRSLWALATQVTPAPTMSALADRGQSIHQDVSRLVDAALRLVVSRVVQALLSSVDLTTLVREHVDLDALAGELDVDAVVDRVDLDSVVARVDLDAAVARVDLDAVTDRLDLDRLVAKVDLDAAVARVDLDAVTDRLDLNQLVAKVDLDAVASQLDLDAIAARLNPDPVVARVDFEPVIARIDLVGIARDIIDAINLPDIVRDSTGTMASDAVRTVRVEGMQADDAVTRLVDRLLRRSRPRTPIEP